MTTSSTPVRRVSDRLALAFFAIAIAVPSVDALARPAEARSSLRERRTPAPKPRAPETWAELASWPHRFEQRFLDTFGARDWLLRGHQALAMFVLRRDPARSIVLGRDGWLYWDASRSRDVHRGVRPFRPDELEEWVRAIEERRAACGDAGSCYVFALAPAKESIYPEYFPSRFEPLGPTRYDQLASRMANVPGVRFVDLRPVLRAERAFDAGGDLAYARLGSHWTWRGACAAARSLVGAIADLCRVPDIASKLAPRERWRVELGEEPGESLGDLTYVADCLHEPRFDLVPDEGVRWRTTVGEIGNGDVGVYESDDPSLPSVVFVHDSFGGWIIPFLAPCFRRMDTTSGISLPSRLVRERRADVVLELFTEHALEHSPPQIPWSTVALTSDELELGDVVLGPLDLSRAASVRTSGSVHAVPRDVGGSAALDVDFSTGDGVLELGEAAIPAGRLAALHARIESPGAGEMWVYWRFREQRGFVRHQRVAFTLSAGANVVRVAIEGTTHPCTLALRSNEIGRYTFSEIEVRALR